VHAPEPVSTAVPAVALTLLAAAKNRRLVVCLGAGVSIAEDAGLPSGAQLGERLDARLLGRLEGYVSPDDARDLIAVADNAVQPAGGLEALQTEILELADFKKATPNYGHQVLGLLLAEGALTALSWNWDNCIERSLSGELLEVARTNEDMRNLPHPHLAKVHGCATMPPTLLITSEQLMTPPVWTDQMFAERIRGSVMVFIGVGDVADYAHRRIQQLLDEFSPPDVRVVSRSIKTAWAESRWATVLPELPDDKRIEADADVFLDALARAWARELVERLRADSAGMSVELKTGVERLIEAVCQLSSVDLLRWCRACVDRPSTGDSAIRAQNTGDVMLAAGVLASTSDAPIRIPRAASCSIGDDPLELLVLYDRANAPDVQREARRRAQDLASRNQVSGGAVRFLVGGTVVGGLGRDAEIGDVLAGIDDPTDIVDGPHASRISYLRASAVLEQAA
jgi:SIR2-like domain